MDQRVMGQKELVLLDRLYGSKSAIEAVMTCAWFTRRWILQEVGLAHDVTIHFGRHKIEWRWFSGGLRLLVNSIDEDEPWFPRLETQVYDSILNTATIQANSWTLDELVWNSHRNECADPRDRLFSLYGLMSNDQPNNNESESTLR